MTLVSQYNDEDDVNDEDDKDDEGDESYLVMKVRVKIVKEVKRSQINFEVLKHVLHTGGGKFI